MSENQDNRPSWMKLNPQIDHFDPFEDIGILQDDEISHARYGVKICQQNLLFDKTILCEAAIKSDIMNELTSQVVEGRKLAEQAGN